VKKKDKNSKQLCSAQKFVDSVRTQTGPRQKGVLNLGPLSLQQDKWEAQANRIGEIILGKQRLIHDNEEIESLPV